MTFRPSLLAASATLAVLALLPSPAAAQTCPRGEITFVFVDNHAIFDPDDLSEEQPLLWAYHLANRLHVRTAESFIRSELLFREGDCWDPDLIEESERLLRLYDFISRADVYGIRQPDGNWHVLVDTRDEWTTRLDLRVDMNRGPRLTGASLAQLNLLGRGIRTSVFYRDHDEQRDVGAEFATRRLLGTRLDLRLLGGRTRIGDFVEQELFYPFLGEVGRVAGRQLFQRRQEFFPYSLDVRRPGAGQPTHVLLPMEAERAEVAFAARVGAPGNLTTFGLGITRSTLSYAAFPGGVEVVRGRDFDDREVAPGELAARLSEQTVPQRATRLNLLVGQRNLRFERRRGLDALTGVQDVAVGSDLALTLGRSAGPRTSGDDASDDLYARARVFLGSAGTNAVANAVLALEGRQLFTAGQGGGSWRDVMAELDVLAYWKPEALPGHTLFMRLEGLGGWHLQQPFQLLLGGATGVRGYGDFDFPASRRLLVTLEDRVYVRWPVPELVDFGFTTFVEAGRGWAGNVPFGVDSGWRGTVGGGLRLGFPAGSQNVIRVDLAFPLGPGTDPGDWILRASLGDLLGLAGGFENRLLDRSRRITVGPDVLTRMR